MNNKGEIETGAYEMGWKSVFGVFIGVIITIVVIVFVFVVGGLQARLTYFPEKIKAEAIAQRFVNIPECFAYQDKDTGRTYSGVVELNKFTNQTLFKCYHTEPEKGYGDYNFRLLLKEKDIGIVTNNYFYGDEFTLFKTVLVKEGDKLIPDTLYIYVQAKAFSHNNLKEE